MACCGPSGGFGAKERGYGVRPGVGQGDDGAKDHGKVAIRSPNGRVGRRHGVEMQGVWHHGDGGVREDLWEGQVAGWSTLASEQGSSAVRTGCGPEPRGRG